MELPIINDATGLPVWVTDKVTLGSVLTAPLGAKMAHKLPVARLKKVFALILYILAAYMLWKGLHG